MSATTLRVELEQLLSESFAWVDHTLPPTTIAPVSPFGTGGFNFALTFVAAHQIGTFAARRLRSRIRERQQPGSASDRDSTDLPNFKIL